MEKIILKNNKKGIFEFFISFNGIDIKHGDRHYLEHVIFTAIKGMSRSEINKKMAQLGVQDSFNAATGSGDIIFSGTYLEEHQEKIAELLASILFSPSLLESEINLEKNIIKNEIDGIDRITIDLSKKFYKKYDIEFSIAGHCHNQIDSISTSHLKKLHKKIFNPENMFIATSSNANTFLRIVEERAKSIKNQKADFNYFMPKSETIKTNQTENNKVFIIFDHKYDQLSRAYRLVKSSNDADFFAKLREEKQLFYSCDFDNNFWEKRSPYLTLFFETNLNPDNVIEEVLNHLTVEAKDVYENSLIDYKVSTRLTKSNPFSALVSLGTNHHGNLNFTELFQEKLPSYDKIKEFGEYLKTVKKSIIKVVPKK